MRTEFYLELLKHADVMMKSDLSNQLNLYGIKFVVDDTIAAPFVVQ